MTSQEIKAVVLDSIPLRKAGRHQEALVLVEDALAQDPEIPTLLALKGAILDDLGRHQEALALYEAALEHAPRIAEYVENAALATGVIWRYQGDTLYALKRYQEALASYDEARRLDPEASTYWQNRGSTLQKLRRYPEAVEAYQRANALTPGNPEALLGLSSAVRSAKRYSEALANAEQALAHASGDGQVAEAWWRKGHALWELRRLDEALAAIEQACALQPNNLTYWEYKTGLLLRMGRLRAGWKALWHTESMFHRWRQGQRRASRTTN
jgi:tetratricopeptide (TPR) repeat protein